ncbi:Streptomycin biosynthesis protein StrG [Symbiodinium microadriaticum]|uniref:Streptomycin biosynthesis protein StrG n=1 Tax=Symbiodinium microadriaticum TaxID=2951 RepID=A0A1Q9DAT3_SYMMI|nr:Streptomycin biosynthesis protein StrG [Symbiodinium microadriaticum]CAE7235994.1 strG [Symbiodinium microadriaticum]CAE7258085.1 strG [Symbiodinium sp. KB8]
MAAMASGDPDVYDLVEQLRIFQKASVYGRNVWHYYCDAFGDGIRDPARHEASFIHSFLAAGPWRAGRGPQLLGGLGGGPKMQRQPGAAGVDGQALLESFPCQWRPLYVCPQKLSVPARFDFRSLVAELLECPEEDLEQVHDVTRSEDFRPCPPLQLGMTLAGLRVAGKAANKNHCRQRWRNNGAHARLQELYRRFVVEEALPGLAAAAGEPVEGFAAAVQTEPVLRVVLPSQHAATKRHRDADYGHIPEELNFWMPLTSVSGCSSLHVESFPGRADFHAIEGGEGDMFRWWGNLCEHYTEANTSTTTRVSLDFRVVVGSFWAAAAKAGTLQQAEKQRRRNHGGSMMLGSYYTWMQAVPAGQ